MIALVPLLDEAADTIISLRAEKDRLIRMHRENASTMEVQAMRMMEHGISCGELEYAIAETRVILAMFPERKLP